MNRAMRWLRTRMGVRVATALASAVAVAVVLVVAGISLVLLLNQSLRASVEDSGLQQADLLGERIQANFTGTGDVKRNALEATGKRGDMVQIVTDYGNESDEYRGPDGIARIPDKPDVQVLGSSDTLDSQPRMSDIVLDPGQEYTVASTTVSNEEGEAKDVLLVAKGFSATGRPITVLVARDLQPVHQAVDTVQLMTTIGVPILVLIAGFFTYLFSGRALRPVEAIRRRVAGLTDRDLSERVPEPASHDEVGRLARTMNEMLARLEASQATQRRFVADASHELRSPLATVSTGLELLGSGMPSGSGEKETVQTLRGETTRLTSLVENLLFLARADERGLAPRREEVDLDEIAEAERVRPSADDRVAVTVSTEPVRVTGDRGQLVRVLRNLVDNARRHADHAVLVAVHADGDRAILNVDDDGPGIPDADRGRVFERFVRLDEARSRGDGGSGLGLAIVSELVAAHGGTVSAERSETLGGARFCVRLPLVAADTFGADDVHDEQDADAAGGGAEPGAVQRTDAPAGDATAAGDDRMVPVSPTPPSREPMRGWRRTGPAAEPGTGQVPDGPAPDPSPGPGTGPLPATGTGPLPATGPAPGGGPEPARGIEPGRGAEPVHGVDPGYGPEPGYAPEPWHGAPPAVAPSGRIDGARPRPQPTQPTQPTPQRAAPPAAEPPTGPLPIRPNTVGSPFDQNATRPIPVVRTAGTAVADGPNGSDVSDGSGGSDGADPSDAAAPSGTRHPSGPPEHAGARGRSGPPPPRGPGRR